MPWFRKTTPPTQLLLRTPTMISMPQDPCFIPYLSHKCCLGVGFPLFVLRLLRQEVRHEETKERKKSSVTEVSARKLCLAGGTSTSACIVHGIAALTRLREVLKNGIVFGI